jgi:hypothetical protein
VTSRDWDGEAAFVLFMLSKPYKHHIAVFCVIYFIRRRGLDSHEQRSQNMSIAAECIDNKSWG